MIRNVPFESMTLEELFELEDTRSATLGNSAKMSSRLTDDTGSDARQKPTQTFDQTPLLTRLLLELSNACIIVGRDLKVLHANRSMRQFFGRKDQHTNELKFSDLPLELGAKINLVLKTGAPFGPFRYEPENSPGTIYSISIVPFQQDGSKEPVSALLVADNLTQAEQLRQLEVEAAGLRLIKSMTDRLVHEIGNAMVPISTHQQLLGRKFQNKEFRESLDHAMADSVKRVTRLISQMQFVVREGHLDQEVFTVGKLVQDAYQDALKHQPAAFAQLECEKSGKAIVITGDRAALKHALAEIMLNALKANSKKPKIRVHLKTRANSEGGQDVQIEVQDNGADFTAISTGKAPSPFFTTRSVGLGLGLAVSQKIIETHHGKLEIVTRQRAQHGHGSVRVSLPIDVKFK
jgi:signal transduction histidine kinase